MENLGNVLYSTENFPLNIHVRTVIICDKKNHAVCDSGVLAYVCNVLNQ